MDRWSLRTNWLKFKMSGKQAIILEELMKHASIYWRKSGRSRHVTSWTWKHTRIWTDYAQKSSRTLVFREEQQLPMESLVAKRNPIFESERERKSCFPVSLCRARLSQVFLPTWSITILSSWDRSRTSFQMNIEHITGNLCWDIYKVKSQLEFGQCDLHLLDATRPLCYIDFPI